MRPTDRVSDPEAVFMLRAFSMGIRFEDLFYMEVGEVFDMMTEFVNDRANYNQIATQEDMDNIFR